MTDAPQVLPTATLDARTFPEVVAHYRLLERIGAGGMGEVFRAHDTKLDRKVALKLLPAEHVGDPERLRRFVAEARAASSLNHPHIVVVYDAGEVAGPSQNIHYIAMELIDGRTLREHIHLERTSLDRLLVWLAQAAGGLAKAHAAGIVHRDLKPDNIMVSADGFAKILDFGIAKLTSAPSDADARGDAPAVGRTSAGAILGIVGYMAPEQVRGATVDHRADVFSFGCILYEAVTRRRAFDAGTSADTLQRILHDDPPPMRALNGRASAELERLVRACLTKDPARREITLDELARRLHALAGPRTRAAWWTAGVVGVVAAGVAVAAYWGSGSSPPAPRAMKVARITQLTGRGNSIDATTAPDGKSVVHVVATRGRYALHLRQIATASDLTLVPAGEVGIWGATFSPDGNYVYYALGVKQPPAGSLRRVPTLGGPSTELLRGINGAVSFSPDGSEIVFERRDAERKTAALVIAGADGRGERTLATADAPKRFLGPAWSPDGRSIAFARVAGETSTIIERSLSDGSEQQWVAARVGIQSHAWWRDGSGLVLAALDPAVGFVHLWDLQRVGGALRKLVDHPADFWDASLSADGSVLSAVKSTTVSNLVVVPVADPSQTLQVTAGASRYRSVAWARSGTFVYSSRESGALDLWTLEDEGREPRRLTSDAGMNSVPALSPDGRTIVFVSDRTGANELWRMDVDGANPKQLTRGASAWAPCVSRDGRWVIYEGGKQGERGLWKVAIDGGAPVRVRDEPFVSPVVSADGRWIAALDMRVALHPKVAVLPFAGGKIHRVLAIAGGLLLRTPSVGGVLRWAPEGTAVAYVARRGGFWNVWHHPLEGGSPQPITRFRGGIMAGFDWSHDGRRLVAIRANRTSDVVLIRDFR